MLITILILSHLKDPLISLVECEMPKNVIQRHHFVHMWEFVDYILLTFAKCDYNTTWFNFTEFCYEKFFWNVLPLYTSHWETSPGISVHTCVCCIYIYIYWRIKLQGQCTAMVPLPVVPKLDKSQGVGD